MVFNNSCAEVHGSDLSPSAELHRFMFRSHVPSRNVTQMYSP